MTGQSPDRIEGERRAVASAGAIALVDGKPPARIQLLRIGANDRRDGGRPYLVRDRAHAEAIVAASAAYHKSTEAMVDYDHQSVYGAKEGVGGRAPAAGWMPRLVVEDDAISADVEWTPAASAAIAAREYRYISPYFGHGADGAVTRIFNAGLTNRPELELRALASQSDPLDLETRMTAITGALGLADDATEAAIVAAIGTLKTELGAVCSALGLAATATSAEIRAAASAKAGAGVDLAQYVPRAEFDNLRGRVDTSDEARRTASVDDAIASGKIAPSSRDWAIGLSKSDPASLATFLGTAPTIVAPGAEQRRAAAIAADTLTDEEKAVCSQMGIPPEAYLASRKGTAK